MKRTLQQFFTLAASVFLTASIFAGTPKESAEKTKITISFHDVTPSDLFEKISRLSGVKVHYIAPKQESLMSLELTDRSAFDAFSYVANLAGLKHSWAEDGVHITR